MPDTESMSKELIKKKIIERRFLEQLLDGTKLDQYLIPIPINCELRKYQQVFISVLRYVTAFEIIFKFLLSSYEKTLNCSL